MERAEPRPPSLRIFCATDAVPKTIRTKVPSSSAADSRQVPRSMADYRRVVRSTAASCVSVVEIDVPFRYDRLSSLGDRPTVGHMALDHGIGVRIPVSQPIHTVG